MRAYTLATDRQPLCDSLDIDFTRGLERWRSCGRRLWEDCRRATPAAELAEEMPDYLLDRYAFRCAMQDGFGVGIRDQFAEPPTAQLWLARTRSRLHGADCNRINPVALEAQAPDTEALHDLLSQWRNHLLDSGVMLSTKAFSPVRGLTWLQIFQNSVLTPFYPPAIPGPSFVDRVSDEQRRALLDRYGTCGIWDLYTFLLRSHEETHREQRGEPMLSELFLAMQWCSFLDTHEQWHWQRNLSTGVSFNLEEPYIRRLSLSADIIGKAFYDTAAGVTTFADAVTYDQLCLCAWLFDARAVNYRQYLDLVVRRLLGIPIVDEIRAALREIDGSLFSCNDRQYSREEL